MFTAIRRASSRVKRCIAMADRARPRSTRRRAPGRWRRGCRSFQWFRGPPSKVTNLMTKDEAQLDSSQYRQATRTVEKAIARELFQLNSHRAARKRLGPCHQTAASRRRRHSSARQKSKDRRRNCRGTRCVMARHGNPIAGTGKPILFLSALYPSAYTEVQVFRSYG
jgi:hypothetical protein